jgi:hypothetical protein
MSALNLPTGPRTPEGKARSSMNALKHGYSSKKIIVMPGQNDDFQQLKSDLLLQIRPEGALEEDLFHHLIRDAWTIHRIELRQVQMAEESGIDPLFDPKCEKEFDRLERYHARYQSSYHRVLRQLRHLQTTRIVQALLPKPLGNGGLPATVHVTEVIRLAKRTKVFYNEHVLNNLIDDAGASKKRFEDLATPESDPRRSA